MLTVHDARHRSRWSALTLACVSLPVVAGSGCSSSGFTVSSIAAAPSGAVAVGGDDATVRLCTADGVPVARIVVAAPVTKIAYSPDGALLAVAYADKLRLCRAQDGRQICGIDVGTWVADFAFSLKGDLIAASGRAGVTLWSLREGEVGRRVRVLVEGHVTQVAFAELEQQALLATASVAGLVRFWNPSTGELCSWRERGPPELGGLSSRRHETWDRAVGPQYGLDCGGRIGGLLLSPDGSFVAVVRRQKQSTHPADEPEQSRIVALTRQNPLTTEDGEVWSYGRWGFRFENIAEDLDDAEQVPVALSPDALVLVFGDGIRGWGHQAVQPHGCIMHSFGPVDLRPTTAITVASDGDVLTGGPDGLLARWRWRSGQPVLLWEARLE